MGDQLDIFGGSTPLAADAPPRRAARADRPAQLALFAADEAVRDADRPADELFTGVLVRDLSDDGILAGVLAG